MKKATIKLCLFFAFSISFYGCENQTRNETDENTEAISGSENVDAPEPQAVKNTCTICNREFEGRGYDEVSEGVWRPCQEPYQCFICSSTCGMRHTSEMNNLLEEAYRIGNQGDKNNSKKDGRIYETDVCSLCKGTGIEKSTAPNLTGEVGRKCPMCEGRGVRSY